MHYEDVKDENPKYSDISNRPDAAILSYPVITSGEKAHRGSFESLFGKDASEEQLSYMSLANEDWANGNFGRQYTVEQIKCQVKAAEEGVLPLPEEAVERIKKEFGMRKKEECSEEKKRIGEPSEEVAAWPVLADTWLKYNHRTEK